MKVVTNCLHFSCEKLDQNQNVRLLSVPTGLYRRAEQSFLGTYDELLGTKECKSRRCFIIGHDVVFLPGTMVFQLM